MDPLSVAASIAGLLQAVAATCKAIKTIRDLPKAFEHVNRHLPLVQRTLKDIQGRLKQRKFTELEQKSVVQILQDCLQKAQKLEQIFTALDAKCRQDDDLRSWDKLRGWYRAMLQGVQGHRVESLMTDVLKHLKELSLYESFALATQEDVMEIKNALQEISQSESSVESPIHTHGAFIANEQFVNAGGYGQQNAPTGGNNTFNLGHNISGGNVNYWQNPTHGLIPTGLPDPRLATKRIENDKDRLLKDSYEWILSNDTFKRWRDQDDARLLWIKGDPGKGKTMLLCGIIQTLEEDTKRNSTAWVPIYFFCKGTDDRFNTAESVMQSLLAFLFVEFPDMRQKYLDPDSTYLPEWLILVQKVKDVLQDLDHPGVYLIVDALDECVDGLQKLLEVIVDLSESTSRKIKVLVSSRNLETIGSELEGPSQKVELSLEKNAASISSAVDIYIAHHLSVLARKKKYGVDLQHTIHEYLKLNANGTFLWVSLVCKQIADMDTSVDDVYGLLENNFPPTLEQFYGRMVDQIKESSRYPGLCEQILAIACVAYRPLSWAEMVSLLKSPTKNSARSAVQSCGSFLTLQEDERLSFVHLSAKEYLVNNKDVLKRVFPNGQAHQHHYVFKRSLENLTRTLKHDMYDLKSSGPATRPIALSGPDPLAQVRYSCVYWLNHLLELDQQRLKTTGPTRTNDSSTVSNFQARILDEYLGQKGVIYRFLEKKYLHWLEALSLLSEIPGGIRVMDKLESYLRNKKSRALYNLVNDAWRFILLHKGIIEIAPLQVYTSALMFSPTNSLINQLYNLPDWIDDRPKIRADWDNCLQVLAFDTLQSVEFAVSSLAFSSDDKRLASGHNDGVVVIWDVTSGLLVQKFKTHLAGVGSVAFSTDGTTLASGSDDETIQLRSIRSADHFQTLRGHTGAVVSIAFSPNGRKLASNSLNRTIKIWDMMSGNCVQTLKEQIPPDFSGSSKSLYQASIRHVAFLRNDHQVISASVHSVKVWDVKSAICTRQLDIDQAESIVIARDSFRAATSLEESENSTIKIWDLTSGDCIQTLVDIPGWVPIFVLSVDGQRLAASSGWGKCKKIWDVTSGKCVQTFESNDSRHGPIAFSADGQRLATDSDDQRIRIWDTNATLDNSEQTVEKHSDAILSIAVSHEGRIVSGSMDRSVKLWDSTSGSCILTLEGHSHGVRSVAISDDGHRIASSTWFYPIKVWDAASGICTETLESPGHLVLSLVFSKDGKRLASNSNNGKVRIWDITSGDCIQTVCADHVVVEEFLTPGIATSTPLSNGRNHWKYSVDDNLEWITQDGCPLICLPYEYRPYTPNAVAVLGSKIAIGCVNGQAVVIGLKDSPVRTA